MFEGDPCPLAQGPLPSLSSHAMFWAASFQMLMASTTIEKGVSTTQSYRYLSSGEETHSLCPRQHPFPPDLRCQTRSRTP